jgi:tetratricopeptide (TPR) repeat protein
MMRSDSTRDFISAYYQRGAAHRLKGNLNLANADFVEAIKIEPRIANDYNTRCWARLVARQQLQQALSDCNESLRIDPKLSDALDSRGSDFSRAFVIGFGSSPSRCGQAATYAAPAKREISQVPTRSFPA